jgi:hypothetical protein
VVAGQRQGAAGELARATGRASGKAVGGGAHPSGGATKRRWRMLRASAFIGGEGAPVADGDGGMTLQCRCRRGKVRASSNGDNGGGWKGLTMHKTMYDEAKKHKFILYAKRRRKIVWNNKHRPSGVG